jgi:miniconductance mechanosensitive channel
MVYWIEQHIDLYGFPPPWDILAANSVVLAAMLITAFLAHWIARRIILPMIARLTHATEVTWDDAFYRHKVFDIIPHMAPVLVLWFFSFSSDRLNALLSQGAALYILVLTLIAAWRILQSIEDIYNHFDISRDKPIKSYLQVIQLILWMVGGFVALGMLINQSPWALLSGLGAATAIIVLIFKDPISGFVAGIQLAANQMIHLGDWIEMPDYKADGEVMEVTLTTLKVRNWDLTITTIPIYALTAGSFRNWRSMEESGARRIKRSLLIELHSVRFCDADLLTQLQRIKLLHDYIPSRQLEITEYNQKLGFDVHSALGGRNLTNIGIFREYATRYLRQNERLRQDMTLMVRQLEPSEFGIPLEVYAFSADTKWVNYESIQADIFDHLVAMIPLFDLKIYQRH